MNPTPVQHIISKIKDFSSSDLINLMELLQSANNKSSAIINKIRSLSAAEQMIFKESLEILIINKSSKTITQ